VEALSEFDDQELKDFGVSKLGWQKKLMRRSREELQKRCATSTSEPPCTQSTNGTLMDHSSSTLGLFLSPIAAVPSPEVLMAQVKSLSVEEDEISQVARPWDGNGWRGLHAKFESQHNKTYNSVAASPLVHGGTVLYNWLTKDAECAGASGSHADGLTPSYFTSGCSDLFAMGAEGREAASVAALEEQAVSERCASINERKGEATGETLRPLMPGTMPPRSVETPMPRGVAGSDPSSSLRAPDEAVLQGTRSINGSKHQLAAHQTQTEGGDENQDYSDVKRHAASDRDRVRDSDDDGVSRGATRGKKRYKHPLDALIRLDRCRLHRNEVQPAQQLHQPHRNEVQPAQQFHQLHQESASASSRSPRMALNHASRYASNAYSDLLSSSSSPSPSASPPPAPSRNATTTWCKVSEVSEVSEEANRQAGGQRLVAEKPSSRGSNKTRVGGDVGSRGGGGGGGRGMMSEGAGRREQVRVAAASRQTVAAPHGYIDV
jgi:hypothetical protein